MTPHKLAGLSIEPVDATLPAGVADVTAFMKLTRSPRFIALESFSDEFLRVNHSALAAYREQWTADPFHTFFRPWEYPFVYTWIQKVSRAKSSVRVLDAGSGVTFFPFYLTRSLPTLTVDCVDYDDRWTETFAKIRAKTDAPVTFYESALADLPYDDASYDIVYSISVLEHTKHYSDIIEELDRVVRPGGRIFITFDVALLYASLLSRRRARHLIKSLEGHFSFLQPPADDLVAVLRDRHALLHDPSYLRVRFGPVTTVRAPFATLRKQAFDVLTVCCLALEKERG
jgi:SAM-dependent methyltransferase